MSLDYIITSKLSIIGSTSSRLSLNSNGNSISLVTPSLLSNTYNIVLPSNIGLQDQVLSLNSSLETDWIDNSSSVRAFSVSDTTTFVVSFSTTFVPIPGTAITPPAGSYFCIFNTSFDGAADEIEFAIFVNGIINNNTFRRLSASNQINLTLCQTFALNGTQTIDVRARPTNNNYGIFQRVLTLYTISF